MKTFFRLQPAERRALMSPLGDAVAKIIYTGSSCEDFLLKFGWKHSLPGKKIDSYSFSLRLWSTRYQQQLIFLTNSSRLILSSMAKSSHLPALPSLLKGRFHSFPAKSIRCLPLSRMLYSARWGGGSLRRPMGFPLWNPLKKQIAQWPSQQNAPGAGHA